MKTERLKALSRVFIQARCSTSLDLILGARIMESHGPIAHSRPRIRGPRVSLGARANLRVRARRRAVLCVADAVIAPGGDSQSTAVSCYALAHYT
jgi:hypothetical protein